MKILLLVINYLFYLYMLKDTSIGWVGVIILILLSIASWAVSYVSYDKKSKAVLGAGVAFNVAVLVFFKYFGGITGVVMPLGLSFYVFQLISLMADSYNDKLEQRPGLLDTLVYSGFFATITSGPIIKSRDFMRDLRGPHKIERSRINTGVQRIVKGLFEKLVIADRLSIAVEAVYNAPQAYSGLSLLFASITYSLQIFFDFAGYSDIVIGIGGILGFKIPENFNLPYNAKDPSDFWRRWHISLSSWLQEYVYIPLGGSRKGKTRTLLNIMITMLISGIWHGSTINFLLWGGVHGIWQVLHRMFRHERSKEGQQDSMVVSVVKTVLTFLAVNFLWIPFRAKDLHTTAVITGRIFTMADGVTYIYSYTLIFGIMLILIQIYANIKNKGNDPVGPVDLNTFRGKLILVSSVLMIILFAYFGNTAFIYSNF